MLSIEQIKKEMHEKMPVASVSTPFNWDGSIDHKGLRNVVDFIVEAGTGLVLLTYGDSLYSILTDREIAEVTRIVTEQTNRRALVVAATGIWWTGECVRFAKYAKELGVDILMSLPPSWAGSCTLNTLKEHYTAISREIPTMIVTALSDRPVPLNAIKELLEENNSVVAIKDDVCGEYGRKMASLADGRWAVLSGGLKENHMDIMPYGVDSYLSVYMRFKPEIACRYWKYIKCGDIPSAVEMIELYERSFFKLVGELDADFDSVIHGAMELAGICGRWRRNPYMDLDDRRMEILKDFLRL
jgi:4-hydroxy-tetrahydrodipicolinate synthase